MAQHDYIISNQSGAAFRQDLNNALSAIVSINSGATAPAVPYAYMLWADTNAGELKQRNAANNAWVTIGSLATANWGLLPVATASSTYMPLAGGTFTGNVLSSATGYFQIAGGTTAQRPGSPTGGMIRFNSTTGKFEGYDGTSWGSLGGGATGAGSDEVFIENSNLVTQSYTLSENKNAVSAGPITIDAGVTVTIPSGASWVVV